MGGPGEAATQWFPGSPPRSHGLRTRRLRDSAVPVRRHPGWVATAEQASNQGNVINSIPKEQHGRTARLIPQKGKYSDYCAFTSGFEP
jgi:hypothetical protein